MKNFDEIFAKIKLQRNRKIISIAASEDEEVLIAADNAVKLSLCDFILVGNKQKTLDIINEHNLKHLKNSEIVNSINNEEAASIAVKLVANNKAHAVMKGLIDTSTILKAVLNKEEGLRSGNILSHVMVLEVPKLKKLILLTDGAMNIDPSPNDLKMIIENSIKIGNSLGITYPKVAMLSAVEKVNPKIPSTIKCAEVVKMWEDGLINNCIIAGPYALDLAISKEAAKIKSITNPVAGDADILIAPYIEVANTLYKGWVFGGENVRNAGVIVGATNPVILTSRSDSHDAKLNSIALSLLME